MSSFTESRRFFLEIIDDMAKQHAMLARFLDRPAEQLRREDREYQAWKRAMAETGQQPPRSTAVRDLSPELVREKSEACSDRELLLMRRSMAKRICQLAAGVGMLSQTGWYEDMVRATELLRVMDVELDRRMVDGEESGDPDDTAEDT